MNNTLRADFHIHTAYSMDSTARLEHIIKRCQKKGIGCIAVTDHDAVEGGGGFGGLSHLGLLYQRASLPPRASASAIQR